MGTVAFRRIEGEGVYQIPDRTHETRVSIRTRAPWDATYLARLFGGGGHIRAAGCTVKASMAAAKRQVRRAVKEMLLNRRANDTATPELVKPS